MLNIKTHAASYDAKILSHPEMSRESFDDNSVDDSTPRSRLVVKMKELYSVLGVEALPYLRLFDEDVDDDEPEAWSMFSFIFAFIA